MGYIQGDGRDQGTLFPVVLDDFVPADHVCRVIQIVIGIAQSGLYCSESGEWQDISPGSASTTDAMASLCSARRTCGFWP
jgi:hypothetical protein